MNPADFVARVFVLIVLVACAIIFAEIIKDAVYKQRMKMRAKTRKQSLPNRSMPADQDWFFTNIEEFRNDFH